MPVVPRSVGEADGELLPKVQNLADKVIRSNTGDSIRLLSTLTPLLGDDNILNSGN